MEHRGIAFVLCVEAILYRPVEIGLKLLVFGVVVWWCGGVVWFVVVFDLSILRLVVMFCFESRLFCWK